MLNSSLPLWMLVRIMKQLEEGEGEKIKTQVSASVNSEDELVPGFVHSFTNAHSI